MRLGRRYFNYKTIETILNAKNRKPENYFSTRIKDSI
jgi:hypothetical protein